MHLLPSDQYRFHLLEHDTTSERQAHRTALTARPPREALLLPFLFCAMLRGCFSRLKRFVDQAVLLGLPSRQPVVAVGVLLDLADRDARMRREDLIQLAFGLQDFAGRDLDVRGLPLRADGSMPQVQRRRTLPLGARREATAPIEAARPVQMVATSELTNCIDACRSWPAETDPPGELI